MITSIHSTEMCHDNERKQLQSDTGCEHVGDYFPTRSTSSFSIYVDVECKQIIVSRNNHDMDHEFRREMRCTEGNCLPSDLAGGYGNKTKVTLGTGS